MIMANPGSAEQMRAQQQTMQPMPRGTMVGMLGVLVIMMIVMIWRVEIGQALNHVFKYIDFGGKYPVLTLMIAGIIMITLSTVIRSFLSDPISQAKAQQIQSEFNTEMRNARLENNLYKMKKLQEIQPQMMQASMEQSTQMMKLMPITMLFVIPIYAWIFYFVTFTMGGETSPLIINMPWGTANLMDNMIGFMPQWIVIYTLISLPIGQLENKLINYYLFKKRLSVIDAGDV